MLLTEFKYIGNTYYANINKIIEKIYFIENFDNLSSNFTFYFFRFFFCFTTFIFSKFYLSN